MNESSGSLAARIRMASDMIGRRQWTEAERLLKEAVMQAPENARIHSLLATVFSATGRLDLAEEEAQQGIMLAPDDYFPCLVMGHLLATRNRFREAEEHLRQAISMAPYLPNVHAELAGFLLGRKRWQEALDASDRALVLDPEDDSALQTRSMALSMLGRRSESHEAIDSALRRSPNDSHSHATLGWSLLRENRPKEALPHFREALRLDPESEFARLGILEAMRARFLPYRLLLMFFMALSRLQSRYSFGLIFGLYVGYVVLGRIQAANPNLAWLITPLLTAYIVFAISTWIAHPVMNAVLMLDPFGRLALSSEERRVSSWVGLTLLVALGLGITAWTTPLDSLQMLALFVALTVPLTANFYHCAAGLPRAILMLLIGAVLLTGFSLTALILLVAELKLNLPLAIKVPLAIAFESAVAVSWIVVIGSQFAVNALVHWQPRR